MVDFFSPGRAAPTWEGSYLHCAGAMLCDLSHQDAPCLWSILGSGGHNRCLSCPSGICLCGHHTEGPSCERCLPGFYGNPFTGQADDCQPCPCPGQSACTAIPESREVVCTHCPLGQRGEWLVPWGPASRSGVLGLECDRWGRAQLRRAGLTFQNMARAPGCCGFLAELERLSISRRAFENPRLGPSPIEPDLGARDGP